MILKWIIIIALFIAFYGHTRSMETIANTATTCTPALITHHHDAVVLAVILVAFLFMPMEK